MYNNNEGGVMALETKLGGLFTGFAASRIGGRSENQDTCACADTPLGFLVLVCDGMGGGPGGKTASMIVAKTIADYLGSLTTSKEPEVAVRESIRLANQAILDFTATHPQMRGMGSTVSGVLLTGECALAFHVGDSRIYQLRGHNVVYRSTDHSKVMELVKAGVITEEQARTSGESNIITQALGHGTEHRPEMVRLPYFKGDRFVLCSDGIWGVFPQKELLGMLTAAKNPAGAVDSTVIRVDETGIANGGHHDNLTLAIIDTKKNSTLPVPMNKTSKIIIGVLGALLVISLAFNVVSCIQSGNDNSVSAADAEKAAKETAARDAANARQIDSLKKVIEKLSNEKDNAVDAARQAKDAAQKQASVDNADILKRLQDLEDAVSKLDKTKDRKAVVNKAIQELEALQGACKNNAEADKAIKKALEQLKDKRNIDGYKADDLKKQAAAISGNIRKAYNALKK